MRAREIFQVRANKAKNKTSVKFFVATTKNNNSENLARISGSLHVDARQKLFAKIFLQTNIRRSVNLFFLKNCRWFVFWGFLISGTGAHVFENAF